MARRHKKFRSDKAGNVFLDVALESSSRAIRVSCDRWYFEPPVGDDGSVNIAAAADQLQQDITSGTLQLRNICEDDDVGFPIEIELESCNDLEALVRAIRRVYREGLRRSNDARLAGLRRCETRLTTGTAALEDQDRRRRRDRRSSDDRRLWERRKFYVPPVRDDRAGERREGAERRSLHERRAA